MNPVKFILTLILLVNSCINSTELQKKPKYVQKKNYKIDTEILKHFLPNVLVLKIFSYHVKTVNKLNYFKHVLEFKFPVKQFACSFDQNYVAIKCENQLPQILNLDDIALIDISDPRYKMAENDLEIKSGQDNFAYKYTGAENKKFDITTPSKIEPETWIINIKATKNHILELIQKMKLEQLELIRDLEQVYRAYIYKVLSKKTIIGKALELALNYDQTRVFFSLPKFFVKIYLSEECRVFEYEA